MGGGGHTFRELLLACLNDALESFLDQGFIETCGQSLDVLMFG